MSRFLDRRTSHCRLLGLLIIGLGLPTLAATPSRSIETDERQGVAPEFPKTDELSIDDRALRRRALEQWTNEILSDSSERVAWHPSTLKNLIASWIAIDLDRGLEVSAEVRKRYGFRDAATELAALAAEKRWDDIVELQSSATDPHWLDPSNWLIVWIRIADEGLEAQDSQLIDRAERQIELIAVGVAAEVAADVEGKRNFDIMNGRIATARFAVAAARLEMARLAAEKLDVEDLSTSQIWDAMSELHQVAGTFPIMLDGNPLTRQPFAMRQDLFDYAALESWRWGNLVKSEDEKEARVWINFESCSLTNWGRIELLPILDRHLGWGEMRLPEFDEEIVGPWARRQIVRGRPEVVLSYLAMGSGSDIAKARLLAILVGAFPPESRRGQTCDRLARKLIEKFETPWTLSQADVVLELALIHNQSAANAPKGRQLALEALSQCSDKVLEVHGIRTALFELLYDATELGEIDNSVSERWKRLESIVLANASAAILTYSVGGLPRSVDLRSLGAPVNGSIYEEHREYYRLMEAHHWLEATQEVDRLALGNGAWFSSYETIGRASANERGLAATLEWSRQVDDLKVRTSIEMGAIREVCPDRYPLFDSLLNSRSRVGLIWGLGWPSGGC